MTVTSPSQTRRLYADRSPWAQPAAVVGADLELDVRRPGGPIEPADPGLDDDCWVIFTSGSTGVPKAVINTQRMLCANQQMLRQCLAFLADEVVFRDLDVGDLCPAAVPFRLGDQENYGRERHFSSVHGPDLYSHPRSVHHRRYDALITEAGRAPACPASTLAIAPAPRPTPPNALSEPERQHLLAVLRSVPEIILGILFVAAVGFGALPGVLALSRRMRRLSEDAVTDATPTGMITTGGTGSILHAMHAYREYAKQQRGIMQPNFVKPETSKKPSVFSQ